MELRDTFEASAARYHRARPRYPEPLFDALQSLAGFEPGASILEIGPATGIATEGLARRGYRVHGVELGPELASAAERNLAAFADVTITNADFDTWEPPQWGIYDGVVAATVWHWLDPETRYRRAAGHLRPGGVLAFWSALHVVPDGGDPFFVELQDVYDEIGQSLPDDQVFPRPGQLPTHGEEIEASGLFEVVGIEHVDWEIVYDTTAYLDLLSTFSGHIAMADWQRDRLWGEIRLRLAARSEPLVRRHWGAALHVARLTTGPTSPLTGW